MVTRGETTLAKDESFHQVLLQEGDQFMVTWLDLPCGVGYVEDGMTVVEAYDHWILTVSGEGEKRKAKVRYHG